MSNYISRFVGNFKTRMMALRQAQGERILPFVVSPSNHERLFLIHPLSRQVGNLRRDQGGQMAIAVVLALPVIFIFLALGMDAGLWFFDHRTAQNQADAAALAAVGYLPAATDEQGYLDAVAAVNTWVTKNGSDPSELDCGGAPIPNDVVIEPNPGTWFYDWHPAGNPDGRVDAVRVCVGRESPSLFASFSGIPWVWVSAAATARVGPATIAAVMPWGLVPSDPECNTQGEMCQADINGDGVVDIDEDCGYYPPGPGLAADAVWGETLCPWGMSEDKVWIFKSAETITPGNFSPITACGLGAVEYNNCIEGETASEFYEAGETVNVGVQTGNLGANTDSALDERYESEASTGPRELECDVAATPIPISGMDPDGKDRAEATYVPGRSFTDYSDDDAGIFYDYKTGCEYRLVSVPVLESLPDQGNEDVLVLGVATFAIAKWDRWPQYGDALGTPDEACGDATNSGPVDTTVLYKCQMVWGYFMRDVRPPQVLLSIGDSDNPFAPNMIAMVE